MDRRTLELLASNPHYKLSPKQIKELEKFRKQDQAIQLRHRSAFPKHESAFEIHSLDLPEEDENPPES